MDKFNWTLNAIQDGAINYELHLERALFRVAYRNQTYFPHHSAVVAIYFEDFNSGNIGKHISRYGELAYMYKPLRDPGFDYNSVEEAQKMCERIIDLLVLV